MLVNKAVQEGAGLPWAPVELCRAGCETLRAAQPSKDHTHMTHTPYQGSHPQPWAGLILFKRSRPVRSCTFLLGARPIGHSHMSLPRFHVTRPRGQQRHTNANKICRAAASEFIKPNRHLSLAVHNPPAPRRWFWQGLRSERSSRASQVVQLLPQSSVSHASSDIPSKVLSTHWPEMSKVQTRCIN